MSFDKIFFKFFSHWNILHIGKFNSSLKLFASLWQ